MSFDNGSTLDGTLEATDFIFEEGEFTGGIVDNATLTLDDGTVLDAGYFIDGNEANLLFDTPVEPGERPGGLFLVGDAAPDGGVEGEGTIDVNFILEGEFAGGGTFTLTSVGD